MIFNFIRKIMSWDKEKEATTIDSSTVVEDQVGVEAAYIAPEPTTETDTDTAVATVKKTRKSRSAKTTKSAS